MSNITPQKTIPNIQALRLLAATGVFLSHIGFGDVYVINISFSAGVNLFFCISAFLMMYTTSNHIPKKFITKRLIRLIPLYWILTILTFVAANTIASFIQENTGIEELVKSLFFIPYVRDGLKSSGVIRPIVGPAWTLRFDIWFMIIFAIAMKINHKARGLIASAVCIAMMIVGNAFIVEGPFVATLANNFWLNYVVGIIAYYIYSYIKKNEICISRQISIVSLCTGFVLLYIADKPVPINSVAAFIVLIAALCMKIDKNKYPKAIMNFGDMSYSFYLTHYYVILIIGIFVNFNVISVQMIIGTIIAYIISLIVGLISYIVIEKWLGNILKKKILGDKQR